METTIIDGKQVAAAVLEDVRVDMAALAQDGRQPGLAVVLVGSDPASQAYVGSKERTCNKLGMFSRKEELPEDTSQEAVVGVDRGTESGCQGSRHLSSITTARSH